MSSPQRPYATPTIETIESSEILELIGPVQGYGVMDGSTGGVSIGARWTGSNKGRIAPY